MGSLPTTFHAGGGGGGGGGVGGGREVACACSSEVKGKEMYKKCSCVNVVVQFYPWFNLYFLSYKLIIVHYHTEKQRKI